MDRSLPAFQYIYTLILLRIRYKYRITFFNLQEVAQADNIMVHNLLHTVDVFVYENNTKRALKSVKLFPGNFS